MSKKLIGILVGLVSWGAYLVLMYPEALQDPTKFIDKISRRTDISIMGINAYPPKELQEYKIKPPLSPRQYGGYHENRNGLRRFALNIDGVQRFYYSYSPKNLKPDTKAAAIVLLHGAKRTGVSVADKWRNMAERHGIKLFAPDGTQKTWSYAPDKPFIRSLLDVIKKDPQIDHNHIYLFGHSAGAIMGKLFTADFSQDFAASALHAGMITDPREVTIIRIAERKIPVCFLTGTFDKVIPLKRSREAAGVFAEAGHDAAFIEIVGHSHWYYTLADWINEKAWACMMQMPQPE